MTRERQLTDDGIRFYECAHSTADHAPDFLCVRRVEYARLERERIDKYGPCPYCEYGLPMGCNHPVEPRYEPTGRIVNGIYQEVRRVTL